MNRVLAISLVIYATFSLAVFPSHRATAEPAHFWISTSSTSSTGPVAPVIKRAKGSTSTFYIWAQPETVDVTSVNPGIPYGLGNLYKELQNLSLNILTSATGIDLINGSINIYNPLLAPTYSQRFQYDYDSTPAGTGWTTAMNTPSPLVSSTDGITGADMIMGLQAYSFSTNSVAVPPNYAGIGPTRVTGDLSVLTGVGPNAPPAWLLASISYKVLDAPNAPTGDVKINLQIGSNGMNHALGVATESSLQTLVDFGASTTPYNASTQRGVSNPNTPDLTIHPCGKISGDYDGNCSVDAVDYVVWRDTFGQVGAGLAADGNNNGMVDSLDYPIWKSNFGNNSSGSGEGGGSLAGGSVPEPASALLLAIGLALAFLCRAR